MNPTPEQSSIVSSARELAHMLINSGPGTGKTSTIVLLAHEMPLQPMLSIAFNKKITEEMQRRMPAHVVSKTLNSIGHGAMRSIIGRNPVLETKKSFEIAKLLLGDRRYDSPDERSSAFSTFIRALGLAKLQGYVPPDWTAFGQSLVTWEELYETLARECDEPPCRADIDAGLSASIKAAYSGQIDFDDQVYLPTLFGGTFPRFPVVMVDEAQDLSPLNHAMLERMGAGCIIAVGDPFQSIYGFRGAARDSMSVLKTAFSMRELPLNTSFRVPISGVKRARKRNPALNWHESAREGCVQHLDYWNTSDVPDGAAVLCRNNAPLFRVALGMIKKGRGVNVPGRDIGPGLVKILQKFGGGSLPRNAIFAKIEAWEREQLAKVKEQRRGSVLDRAECLRVFADSGQNLGEAIAFADHLFKQSGNVQLMSGHKAKGLEFTTVFHLDQWRIPSKWAKRAAIAGDNSLMEQELNIQYVIETRFKENLFLVDTERFEDA